MTQYLKDHYPRLHVLFSKSATININDMRAIYHKCQKELCKVVENEALNLEDDCAEKYATIDELLFDALHGSIMLNRAMALGYFVGVVQPKSMIEIGSYLGLSTKFFLDLMEPWGGRITSIDPNIRYRQFEKPRKYFKKLLENDWSRIRCIDGFWISNDSIDSDWDYLNRKPILTKEEISKKMMSPPIMGPQDINEKFDMGFIDGAHDYESAQRDFKNLCKIMKPHGCILFDDTNPDIWPEIFRVIMDLKEEVSKNKLGYVYCGVEIAAFFDNGYFETQQVSS